MIRKCIFCLTIIFFHSYSVHAQYELTPTVIASGGKYASVNGYEVNYTIGESVGETFSSGSYVLTQGFNQNDTSYTVSISENDNQSIFINAYPNPIKDFLNVFFTSQTLNKISVEVYDLTGKILLKKLVPANTVTKIDFQNFSAGLYFLSVQSNKSNHETIKITKN